VAKTVALCIKEKNFECVGTLVSKDKEMTALRVEPENIGTDGNQAIYATPEVCGRNGQEYPMFSSDL